ncbi:hypothetical protein BGZ89_002893 [Linnemannia elongata]|nr:hypothetical protein BGZ89_002893 [Linnemannia elongata]
MNYTLSSSFNYTPDVVDFEAMNITDMFPEQSSFSFDMSNSYSDSISGIPLAQQALWDDGQLTLPNSSRVFNSSSLSSSVNSSINYGHPQQQQLSQHLRVPTSSSHHGRHHLQPHPLSQQYQGSPLRGDDGYLGGSQDDEDDGGHDFHGDESSGHLAWMDDTKDQQGIMLHYNDQERRDEQHLQFLQDIGAGSVSRGDSISLFDELNDASELSCDLFKEQINIDETRDQSRLPFEHHTLNTHSQFNNAAGHLENEIFDREFMASLNAPPSASSFSPMDPSSAFNNNTQGNIVRRNPNNILDGLHSIPTPELNYDESIHLGQRKHGSRYDGSERSGTGETYQKALKSFFDSLKVADPIKTPHKFAPQPLPILWNEPKIRSKNLPSFNLADYKELAKATMPPGTPTSLPPFKPTTTANGTNGAASKSTAATGLSNRLNGNTNRDSFSSSPTNTHSIPNSAHSSPLSSISTSPPTAGIRSKMPLADPKTPTAATYTSKLTYPPSQPQDKEPGSPQQQQLSLTTGEQRVRSKRRSTILNPHLAFDPTIPPAERTATEEVKTPTTPRGTLERRSTLQQTVRPKVSEHEDPRSDEDAGSNEQQQQGTVGKAGSTMMSGLRGPVIRKRRSLHQDMFMNDNGQEADFNQAGHEQQQPHHQPKEDFADHAEDQQQQQQDEALARRGSRPQSMNILPESLTSVNNHAFHHEETAKVERVERTHRLSEEERHTENFPNDAPAPTSPSAAALTTGSAVSPANSRIPAALSLGRAAGARFGRSGSGGAGSLAQMSPTTPTAANPYGSLNARTAAGAAAAVAAGGAGSRLANVPHRLSLTGTTAAFARQQLDDAAAASPSTPTQAQYLPKPASTTLSRSGTRSSPPTTAGLRRPGIQQQALEEVYGHGSGYGSNYPDEQGGFIDDHHRHPPQQGQSRYQAQLSPRHLRDQRDDHFRSSMLASPPSPLPPSPRDYLSATATTPKASSIQQHHQSRYSPPIPSSALPSLNSGLPPRTSEHYRRQSKDGYSLMSAPRISPPLNGLPTSSARTPSSSQLANPRRSLSQGLSGASTLPSRRLSTTANVGNDGLGNTGSGIGMGLHGRSGSSGSLQRSNTYSSQPLPSAGGRSAAGGVSSLYSDGNLPSVAGSRRPVSSMMSNGAGGGGLPLASRRSASDSMSSNVRASSGSEYARVFNPNPPPPLRSSIPSAGGNHYQHQQQQDSYTYRPEVPLRQSSLGAGGMASGIGGSGGGHLSNRSSIATLRSGSSGSLHGLSTGGSGSIPPSASQLRRAASMNVSAAGGAGGHNGLGIGMGGGGTTSLGRAGGMMFAAAAASRQSYQPQGMQSQQMQIPQQRYQRTSMYSHRS